VQDAPEGRQQFHAPGRDEEQAKESKAVTIINEMINESLEVEQLVADTFNRELRAFKANQKR
jgi:hypothetical protein